MMNKDASKKTARALEKALAELGINLKHGQALGIVAKLSGFSHFGAMPKVEPAAAAPEAISVIPPRALRLPSVDGGHYDRFVLVPPDMGYLEALKYANQVIAEVNFEDQERDECLDGESVEDNIRRRLSARGYVWPNVDTTSDCWDEYNERWLAEPENWPEVRAHFGLPEDLEIRNEEKHIYAWKYGSSDGPGSGAHDVPATPESDAGTECLSGPHVWRAALYLDGQTVLGEPRIAVSASKTEVRQLMLDEYWDPRLDSADATPVLHIEQLDDGSHKGPFRLVQDGEAQWEVFDQLLAAARWADIRCKHGFSLCEESVAVIDADDEELFVFKVGGKGLL
jgi:hypothetical protein